MERDVIAAEAAATRARRQLDDAPPEPQDLSQLQATWDKWSAVADITLAKNAVATEQAQLTTIVAGLPATWADLVAAGLPARETLLDLTGALATAAADLASNKAELEAKEAYGRGSEVWEQANVMVFLASDYASYMTGETISTSSQRA